MIISALKLGVVTIFGTPNSRHCKPKAQLGKSAQRLPPTSKKRAETAAHFKKDDAVSFDWEVLGALSDAEEIIRIAKDGGRCPKKAEAWLAKWGEK